jgi:hypothetical protein
VFAAALAGSVFAPSADQVTPAACNRECLKGFIDSYLDAMAQHNASKLPAAAAVKFTENGKVLQLGEGFWKTAGPSTYRLYALDPSHGDAAVQAVVKENGEAVIFLVRLKVDRQKIQEAETIVCRKGQAGFFSPEKLTAAPPIFAQAVPESARATHEQLIAAADAYFTAVQSEGSKDYQPAPLAAEANRFENGLQTTNVPVMGQLAMSASEQLDKGVFPGLTIDHRRFPVADATNGVVLGLVLMHAQMNGQNLGILIGEIFKVSGAKIRRIQAVMVNTANDGPTGWN